MGEAADLLPEMDGPQDWPGWFTGRAEIEAQMRNQAGAADWRIVEWHFAEQPVADFFLKYAEDDGLTNIIVVYTPPAQP